MLCSVARPAGSPCLRWIFDAAHRSPHPQRTTLPDSRMSRGFLTGALVCCARKSLIEPVSKTLPSRLGHAIDHSGIVTGSELGAESLQIAGPVDHALTFCSRRT